MVFRRQDTQSPVRRIHMHPLIRKIFPYAAILLCLGSIAWAVSFRKLPRADFAFTNGDEVQTLDPSRATGSPEGRIINAVFEGLLRNLPTDAPPDKDGLVPMRPAPGVAESYQISEDGKVYTFKFRPDVKWSDGTPVTAHDFVWSWRRTLHPETASQYAYQLKNYLVNADKYNGSNIEIGDRVEVELFNRKEEFQPFPRGTILAGVLKEVVKSPEPQFSEGTLKKKQDKALEEWRKSWTYVVEIKAEAGGQVAWTSPGQVRRFSRSPKVVTSENELPEKCHHVLLHFDEVGVKAPDTAILVVTLKNRTPYFHELAAFYPLYPVNRACVEKYGTPNWTRPENIIGNGAFQVEFRRLRDRIRLVKNPHYWNANSVQLNVVDAMAVESETTALNLYLNGQVDWVAAAVPSFVVPELKQRKDYLNAPMLSAYFYRMNVTRPPLDNKLVRQALNLAIDKQKICERVTKAGQQPARSFVPPGLNGYRASQCGEFNPERAAELLEQAGYKGGQGLPKIPILYNNTDTHRDIAETIGQDWKAIGVDVEYRALEWGIFLATLHKMDYDVARSAWVGDYPDPNTFLDMFVTGGENNETGWSNKEYDRLIEAAAAEPDTQRRLDLLHDAEAILMEELPILPIYFYVSNNLVSPRVKGFSANIQDLHPLEILRLDP